MFNVYNPKIHFCQFFLSVYNIKKLLHALSSLIILVFALCPNNLTKCLYLSNQNDIPPPLCLINTGCKYKNLLSTHFAKRSFHAAK